MTRQWCSQRQQKSRDLQHLFEIPSAPQELQRSVSFSQQSQVYSQSRGRLERLGKTLSQKRNKKKVQLNLELLSDDQRQATTALRPNTKTILPHSYWAQNADYDFWKELDDNVSQSSSLKGSPISKRSQSRDHFKTANGFLNPEAISNLEGTRMQSTPRRQNSQTDLISQLKEITKNQQVEEKRFLITTEAECAKGSIESCSISFTDDSSASLRLQNEDFGLGPMRSRSVTLNYMKGEVLSSQILGSGVSNKFQI